jgi:hypothetical protein
MEECDFTQTDICEKGRFALSQVNRYVHAIDRPETESFEKLASLFPPKHRIALLLAFLEDEVPAKYRNLISITPRTGGSRVSEEPSIYRSRMPTELRTAYDGLGAAALEKPAVAQSLIATYKVLRAKA